MSGRVEMPEGASIKVYDRFGRLNQYLSEVRLRSWSVFHYGILLPEWSHIMPEDATRLEQPRWP